MSYGNDPYGYRAAMSRHEERIRYAEQRRRIAALRRPPREASRKLRIRSARRVARA